MWTRWPTNAWSTQAENVGLEEGRLELMSQLIYESTKTNVWKYYFYFLFTVWDVSLFEKKKHTHTHIQCPFSSVEDLLRFSLPYVMNRKSLGFCRSEKHLNTSPQLFNQMELDQWLDQQSQAFHSAFIMSSCLFDASVLQTCPPAFCVCVWRVQCIVRKSAQTWPVYPPCLKRRPICMPASTRSRRSAPKILLAFVSLLTVSITTCLSWVCRASCQRLKVGCSVTWHEKFPDFKSK